MIRIKYPRADPLARFAGRQGLYANSEIPSYAGRIGTPALVSEISAIARSTPAFLCVLRV